VVVAVGAPHTERAARALAAELALDRLFDSPVEIGIDAEMLDRGEAVHIEKRHGDADGLLRTAVWVALQGRQQRRRVERAEGGSGNRDRPRAGNEVGEEIARDGLARAG